MQLRVHSTASLTPGLVQQMNLSPSPGAGADVFHDQGPSPREIGQKFCAGWATAELRARAGNRNTVIRATKAGAPHGSASRERGGE